MYHLYLSFMNDHPLGEWRTRKSGKFFNCLLTPLGGLLAFERARWGRGHAKASETNSWVGYTTSNVTLLHRSILMFLSPTCCTFDIF